MREIEVSAYWTGEALTFTGIDSRGNEVVMGGAGNMSPAQMLLLGLAGCMGMDVLSILQKKRQQVSDIRVEVTAQQPEEYPRPYQAAAVRLIITGEGLKPEAVRRAIALSEEKYCVVGQTLQNQVAMSTSFSIREERRTEAQS